MSLQARGKSKEIRRRIETIPQSWRQQDAQELSGSGGVGLQLQHAQIPYETGSDMARVETDPPDTQFYSDWQDTGSHEFLMQPESSDTTSFAGSSKKQGKRPER